MASSSQFHEPGTAFTCTEEELAAYTRGELPGERRAEIEGFLACNPDLAAQVMTEMHLGRRFTEAAKRRGLSRGFLAARPRVRWTAGALAVVATALVCAGAGWAIRSAVGFGVEMIQPGEPEYVEEAVISHHTTLIREGMTSQPESTRLDPREIQRATQIRLPAVPSDWRIRDVQIYPSDTGPSVQVLGETPEHVPVTLYAVRADTAAVGDHPVLIKRQGQWVAYWELGGLAFALTAASRDVVQHEALAMANRMRL